MVQAVLYQLYRHYVVFLRDGAGDILGQLHRQGYRGQVHEVHAQLYPQRVDELRLGDESVLYQYIAQPLAVLLGDGEGLLQLCLGDDTGGYQQADQSHIGYVIHLQWQIKTKNE